MNCAVYTKALVTENRLVKKAVVIKRKGGSPEVTGRWKPTPAKLNGKPTPVRIVIPFDFRVKTIFTQANPAIRA